MEYGLIIPAFIAGVITFFAPCTFPLVPGYLGFISGVSAEDLRDPVKSGSAGKNIFFNGAFFAAGFSFVFVVLGSLFGLGGSALIYYRLWIARIGGVFVIFFGLFMLGVFKPYFLSAEKRFRALGKFRPGRPMSSFIFGATFAFGWTPCVGPILGSVLTLAAASATVGQGAFLLFMFSLGLALPFLAVALSIGSVSLHMAGIEKYLNAVSFIGGVLLVILGLLLLTDKLSLWISYFYNAFDFMEYDSLLKYL